VERELESVAPSPAPSVAAPASAAGPSLSAALTPARVLALQRTAGNQAVTALLSRDEAAAPTPAGGPGDFGHSGGAPTSSGSVTATPNGSDKVRVQAPAVTLDGEAWLKDGKTLGGTAYIGIVQNLVHSDRGAVYRHGGDPAGEITAEHHTAQGNKRDAVSDPAAAAQGKMEPGTFAPFYWKPGSIDDANIAGNPAKATHLGTPVDQPEFSMPVQDGPGRITSFRGHDNFKMGMAIKKDAAIHMLTGSEWSVSWDVPVDASMNGAGKAVQTKAIQDLLNDGPDPNLKDWSLAPGAGSAFEGFSTTALAMQRTPKQLLGWLFAAREHDPTSYKNICAALDAKAPELSVAIHCDTTDGYVGKDRISASVKRNGALVKTEANIELNNGEDSVVKVGWADAIGSAAGLTAGTAIGIELAIGSDGLTAIATLPFPFNGSRSLTPGSGKYSVTLTF
jgi:hypothetical protein